MGTGRRSRVEWFSPDPRGILPLDGFRTSARLRRTIRQQLFDVRVDTAFEAMMQACADRQETWITPTIIRSYVRLHEMGLAHSVEAWQNGALVGGLYGVALNGAFFGESMFHTVADASKVALVALVERLQARGFALLDTQWVTPHLASFGAVEIPRDEYLQRLRAALDRPVTFG